MHLLIQDDHAETAANRQAQLAAIMGESATVAATSSRNKLLADIARAREPVVALIDLVDERDRRHRLGDRIITTISRHPDLRERCIPVALTFHTGVEIESAVYRAGARALINSRVLSCSCEHEAIRRLLVDLQHRHGKDARRPRLNRPLTVLPLADRTEDQLPEERFAASEFQRWFDQPLEPWTLCMLEAIADQGAEQLAIVRRMVALQATGKFREAAPGTWKNRHTSTWRLLRGGGRHPPDLAAEFLSHVRAELQVSPEEWRQPSFDSLQRAQMQPQLADLVTWAAMISPVDREITAQIIAADAGLAPPKDSRKRMWTACQAAATPGRSLPAKALLTIAGFVAHAIHDAKTDYDRRPAVEAGHRLRRIVVPTFLLHRQPDAGEHTFFTAPARLTLDATGELRLDGMTAEQWEQSSQNPPIGALTLLQQVECDPGLLLRS